MSKGLLTAAKDDRDILAILESELNFLEKGGYGRSVRTPWLSTSVFQDSPSCFCFPFRDHNETCGLMQFVPAERRAEGTPCHHIPLNAEGDTVDSLAHAGEQGDEVDEVVKNWLRRKIAKIQQERTETRFCLA